MVFLTVQKANSTTRFIRITPGTPGCHLYRFGPEMLNDRAMQAKGIGVFVARSLQQAGLTEAEIVKMAQNAIYEQKITGDDRW